MERHRHRRTGHTKWLAGFELVLVLVLTASCGGAGGDTSGGGTTPPPPPPTVASLSIAATGSDTLASFQDGVALAATARDASNAAIPGATITWATSDPTVVSLSATSGGSTTATAVANGTATITATSGSVSATHTVAVVQRMAAASVTPATLSLAVGGSQQLSASAADARGGTFAGALSAWTSSDATKATVTTGGLVQGVAPGTATITATMTGGGVTKTATAAVTVSGGQVASITVAPAAGDTLYSLGDSRVLTASARDATGAALTDASIQWSVDRTDVATVSPASGASSTVSAAGSGVATVTARSGSASGTAVVTIRQRATKFSVTPATLSLALGGTQQLTAAATDARGNKVGGLAAPTFTSSDTTRLKVSSAGLVTAVGSGSATITAAQATPDGALSATVNGTTASFSLTATVSIVDYAFGPQTVDIASGGTVTWTWDGTQPHTVTPASGTGFGSDIKTTGSYSAVFAKVGSFDYYCSVHTYMTGTIVVH